MKGISKILFYVGNTLLFLTGIAHLIGGLSGTPEPVNDQQKQLLELLPKTMFEMPSGEMRSYLDIHNAFSLYFVVFPIGLALILWIVSPRKTAAQAGAGGCRCDDVGFGSCYIQIRDPSTACHDDINGYMFRRCGGSK